MAWKADRSVPFKGNHHCQVRRACKTRKKCSNEIPKKYPVKIGNTWFINFKCMLTKFYGQFLRLIKSKLLRLETCIYHKITFIKESSVCSNCCHQYILSTKCRQILFFSICQQFDCNKACFRHHGIIS